MATLDHCDRFAVILVPAIGSGFTDVTDQCGIVDASVNNLTDLPCRQTLQCCNG